MNPYDTIYYRICMQLRNWGFSVFTDLPDNSQEYPYIIMGDQINTDVYTKDYTSGQTTITLHAWSNTGTRYKISQILEHCIEIIYKDSHSTEIMNQRQLVDNNFTYNVTGTTTSILQDNSQGIPLWHGILIINISF